MAAHWSCARCLHISCKSFSRGWGGRYKGGQRSLREWLRTGALVFIMVYYEPAAAASSSKKIKIWSNPVFIYISYISHIIYHISYIIYHINHIYIYYFHFSHWFIVPLFLDQDWLSTMPYIYRRLYIYTWFLFCQFFTQFWGNLGLFGENCLMRLLLVWPGADKNFEKIKNA